MPQPVVVGMRSSGEREGEVLEEIGGRRARHPGCGQLQRQRNAAKVLADRQDVGGISGGDIEIRLDRADPIDEQANSGAALH